MKPKSNFLTAIFIISLLFTFLIWYQCLTDTNHQFQSFTRALFQKELATNTISLHYTLKEPSAYQLEGMPVSFGGVSSDIKKTSENISSYKEILSKFNLHNLSSENKLTHQILSSYLETAARGCEYLLYQEPFSPVIGIHAQLPLLLSEFAFYDSGDIDTYLELLGETPNYFSDLIAFEKKKSDAGLFMADYQVDSVISFCQSFLDMGTDNYLFSSFEERLNQLDGLTSEQMKSYLTLNQTQVEHKVFPAYENLIGQLRLLKGSGTNEMGLCYLPKGKEYYEHLAQQQTGIRASVPALQTMAETQISQDAKDVQKYFVKDVEASSDLLLENVTSILDSLKKKSASAFPQIPQVNTQVKFVPSDMEDFLSPAFYMIPPIDTFSFFKNAITNGILTNPVSISAKGCEICIPTIPQKCVVTIKVGININPERNIDKKEEIPAFRILWYSIFTGTENAKNTVPKQEHLSANTPISFTCSLFWKTCITCSANTAPGIARQEIKQNPIPIVTNNPFFTRLYSFAW